MIHRPPHLLACAAFTAMATLNAIPTLAATFNVVSPPEFANAEAPDSAGAYPSVPVFFQAIERADVFGGLPGGAGFLNAISTRPDELTAVGTQASFDRLQIRVGTTTVDPASMSNTFADNRTGPLTLVYDGPWSGEVTNPDPTGPATRPFDYVFPLDDSFLYNPADGNLIVEWTIEGPTSTLPGNSLPTDTAFLYSGPQKWKWTDDLGADSPVGVGEFAIVTQYSFTPVPEPNTAALAAVGGLFAGFVKRARQKNCEGRVTIE